MKLAHRIEVLSLLDRLAQLKVMRDGEVSSNVPILPSISYRGRYYDDTHLGPDFTQKLLLLWHAYLDQQIAVLVVKLAEYGVTIDLEDE